jgi:hypothetical protein
MRSAVALTLIAGVLGHDARIGFGNAARLRRSRRPES